MSETHTITLPDIGEGVVEGEVIEWLKNVGDSVKKDEPVVVVMTDKATVELPSPYPGKLVKQHYKPGEMAITDQPLYEIESEGKVITLSPEPTPSPPKPKENVIQFQRIETEKVQATPKTRELAKELGIDINLVRPSGQDGRVTESDVVSYHASIGEGPPSNGARASPDILSSTPVLHMDDDDEVPVTGLRHIIAEKMVESKYIVPHFSYFDQFDATRLVKLRKNLKEEGKKEGLQVSFMPLLIKALSLTIHGYPYVNSSFDLTTNNIIVHKHHNIGIAIKRVQGLVVCTLKNVQNKSLQTVIREYDALMKKASDGKLEREDMAGSTITITNFGPLGGMWATPIINYPEVAILGVAKIQKQPVVQCDEVVIREMMNFSWSFDHRVIDGDVAAGVSNGLIKILKNPAQLL